MVLKQNKPPGGLIDDFRLVICTVTKAVIVPWFPCSSLSLFLVSDTDLERRRAFAWKRTLGVAISIAWRRGPQPLDQCKLMFLNWRCLLQHDLSSNFIGFFYVRLQANVRRYRHQRQNCLIGFYADRRVTYSPHSTARFDSLFVRVIFFFNYSHAIASISPK